MGPFSTLPQRPQSALLAKHVLTLARHLLNPLLRSKGLLLVDPQPGPKTCFTSASSYTYSGRALFDPMRTDGDLIPRVEGTQRVNKESDKSLTRGPQEEGPKRSTRSLTRARQS